MTSKAQATELLEGYRTGAISPMRSSGTTSR
jgi:hypothetical protein